MNSIPADITLDLAERERQRQFRRDDQFAAARTLLGEIANSDIEMPVRMAKRILYLLDQMDCNHE